MAYDIKRKDYSREHIDIVEVKLDYCSRTYGSAPCTASHFFMVITTTEGDKFRVGDTITGSTTSLEGVVLATEVTASNVTVYYYPTGTNFSVIAETITSSSGGAGSKSISSPVTSSKYKCFNTRASCQDLTNYDGDTATPKTYRFCSSRSPQPIGLDAIPSLDGVSISPTKIDISGGLGARASASISFDDHPHSDIGIDKYISDRDYEPFDQGTFWTKLRARNAGYENREAWVYSGYLEKDGSYDVNNFQIRKYIIDEMSVANGKASIKAKDPLKLAMKEKALAPEKSDGKLSTAITGDPTTFTLASGYTTVYPASGKVCIDNEIISYSSKSGDVFTITATPTSRAVNGRGQNNTVSADHSQDANVQLVYESNNYVDIIARDLLVNYAGVPSEYIPVASWESERKTTINYLLDGIIPKPTDVNKLLKELAESAPHYLYWDETANEIQFKALNAPDPDSLTLSEDIIIQDSMGSREKPDMRYSTVIVNFDQFNPTEKLDEPSNYQQGVVRVDSDSLAEYKGKNKIKTIYSRWMSNEAFANNISALIGRRFAFTPREISFSIDPKDADFWAGDQRYVQHRDMADFYGLPENRVYQMISAVEGQNKFKYTALEFKYGAAIVSDIASGVQTLNIGVGSTSENINLYSLYEANFGVPTGDVEVQFIVGSGNAVGSTSTGTYSIETGSEITGQWLGIGGGDVTSLSITLIVQSGALIFGKGGDGGGATAGNGGNGGDAILADVSITITVDGTLGSGGGGGAGREDGNAQVAGSGGAGLGSSGSGTSFTGTGTLITLNNPSAGTTTLGGDRGFVAYETTDIFTVRGGDGGDLGQAGTVGSGSGTSGTAGAAGDAIVVGANIVAGDVTLNGSGDVFGGLNGVTDGTV